jgi:hypothetical protein
MLISATNFFFCKKCPFIGFSTYTGFGSVMRLQFYTLGEQSQAKPTQAKLGRLASSKPH